RVSRRAAPPAGYPLSLHDALPIFLGVAALLCAALLAGCSGSGDGAGEAAGEGAITVGFSQVGAESEWRTANTRSVKEALVAPERSEEHTSELQSRENLVCRLLLEK